MLLSFVLLPLLGLISFVGFVWLVVVAFRHSALWGILVLLLSPITAIVFAIKNWEDSKRPFLVYAGSSVGSVLVVIMIFAQMGGFQMMSMAHQMSQGELTEQQMAMFANETMDRMEASGMLDEQEQQQLQAMREEFPPLAGATEEPEAMPAEAEPQGRPDAMQPPRTAPGSTMTGEPRPAPAPGGGTPNRAPSPVMLGEAVSFDDAPDLVGQVVKVRSTFDRSYTGRLLHADSELLIIEVELSAGSMTFELTGDEVVSIEPLHR